MSREEELQAAIAIVADYFPETIIELARICIAGNKQHYGGTETLFWDRSVSTAHFTKGVRHWTRRGERDDDGTLHTGKAVWRAAADCQIELEKGGAPICPAAMRAPLPYGEAIPHSLAAEIQRDILQRQAESDDDLPGDDVLPNEFPTIAPPDDPHHAVEAPMPAAFLNLPSGDEE